MRLLLLTAQRRDEVGSMQWAELDTFSGLWTLPGARTKNHREHLLPWFPPPWPCSRPAEMAETSSLVTAPDAAVTASWVLRLVKVEGGA